MSKFQTCIRPVALVRDAQAAAEIRDHLAVRQTEVILTAERDAHAVAAEVERS